MKGRLLLIIFLSLFSQLGLAQDGAYGPSLGKGSNLQYIEDGGTNLWQQDTFLDPDSPEAVLGTQSGEYVGEEEVQAFEDAARAAAGPGVDLASALEKDKQMLPDNLMYGLATGLTIGGWFALLQGKNGADNARYIGGGMVAGALLGIAIGTKSVYQPLLRQSSNFQAPPTNPFLPQLEETRAKSLAGLSWQFKF